MGETTWGSLGEPTEASVREGLGFSGLRDVGDVKGKDMRCEGKDQGMSKRTGNWSLVSRTKDGTLIERGRQARNEQAFTH